MGSNPGYANNICIISTKVLLFCEVKIQNVSYNEWILDSGKIFFFNMEELTLEVNFHVWYYVAEIKKKKKSLSKIPEFFIYEIFFKADL